MAKVILLPDIKTPGGEVSDILINERYVGSLSLIYRENDRVSGAIQLEKSSLSKKEKKQVISFVQEYIQSFVYAINAKDCMVIVTFSKYDHIINLDMDDEYVYDYDLVLICESEDHVEYHLYDEDHEWIAEAVFKLTDQRVEGEVRWMFEPTEEEVEFATEVLVAEFDEDLIDTIVINHNFKNELIEQIDLSHKDLLYEDLLIETKSLH